MMEKRLRKSNRDKVLTGVCGGIAEYFSIDSIIVRLIFVFTVGGTGIVYLILALMLPDENSV